MKKEYRYVLEPCSGRQYQVCPSCGHTRYVRYIDSETGEYLSDELGICERRNNCGYHKSPKELITNPLNNKKMETKNENESVNVVETTSEINPVRIEKNPMLAPVEEENIPEGALLYYLITIYGKKAVLRVAKMYRLYHCKIFAKDGKFGIGFPQIDKDGKTIRQIKTMAYNNAGKRLKEGEELLIYNKKFRKYEKINCSFTYAWTSPIKFMAKDLMYGFNFVNQQCLFGTHLLSMFPDKIVIIVESEKSALIGTLEFPQFIWLACGGIYGAKWSSPQVFECLKGRTVKLAPDLEATEDWKLRAETLVDAGIDVSVFEKLEEHASAEDKANGLDIADFFLRNRIKENPQLVEAPVKAENKVKAADIPDFDGLFGNSTLDKPEPQISGMTSEEFKTLLPTDDDIKKFDKKPKTTLEHDFSDIDKIIGLNSDAVADIA